MSHDEIDAEMDPWTTIEIPGGEVLFGFLLRHNELGGLSWGRSSPIVEIDEHAGRARTQSGRRYRLGCQEQLWEMGPEALVTASTLVPWAFDVPLSITDLHWAASGKAARWLNIEKPKRNEADIQAWNAAYLDVYLHLRTVWGAGTDAAAWMTTVHPDLGCTPSEAILAGEAGVRHVILILKEMCRLAH